MRVVFWQNILSFYQVPHITALAAQPDTEVVWVVRQTISPDRVAQGWKVPEVSGVQVVVAPDEAEVAQLVSDCPKNSVHIFSGIHQEPMARKAFYLSLKTPAQIGLLNEPPFPGRLRDLVSPVLHGVHRLVYGKRISFILAMGHMAVDFYHSVGYSSSVVFPYGYFPDATQETAAVSKAGPVQILYLGQLIERKGVDILIRALGALADLDWALTVIGSGDQEDALKALAAGRGMEGRVTFLPPQENEAAMQKMAQSDVFVLPSRHDGWGVVVNEALLRGVPVICSDHCGASDLLQDPWRGETFKAGSVSDLETVLRRWVMQGKRTPEEAQRIQDWSGCITGRSAAAYLRQVVEWTRKPGQKSQEPRPLPPWRKEGRREAEGSKR